MLFALQVLFGFVGVYFLFLAVEVLSGERKELILLAGILYLSLYAMGSGGNTEGEWLLPFVSLSYYFYVKGMKKGGKPSFRLASFFAGIEVGCSLNSRPLDGIWGGVIAVAFFVYALRKKLGWELLFDALFALAGLALIYALILPFAIAGGYFEAMMKAIFTDSFAYTQRSDWQLARWHNRLLIVGVYLLGVLFYGIERKRGDRQIALFFFVSASLATPLYFLVARFTTYYWSGYPFYILNLIYAVSLLDPWGRKHPHSWVKPLLGLWALFATTWSVTIVSLYYTVGINDFSYASAKMSADFVLKEIPEEERMKKGNVFALDLDAGLYLVGGITTNEKYLVNQSNWAVFLPEVKDEVARYLASPERPHYLLVNLNEPLTEDNFGSVITEYYTFAVSSPNQIGLYLSK